MAPEALQTQEQFVEQYRRLCGHIAKDFVFRTNRKTKLETGSEIDHSRLRCEVEDLASAALVRLVRCPERFWNEKFYVNRLIVNAIIKESTKLKKVSDNEHQAPQLSSPDFFDTLPGRDGLAGHTQTKFDSAKILSSLHVLTQGERLVVEFYFGLNGLQAIGEYAISSKMGRTRRWVQQRLHASLLKLRREVGVRA